MNGSMTDLSQEGLVIVRCNTPSHVILNEFRAYISLEVEQRNPAHQEWMIRTRCLHNTIFRHGTRLRRKQQFKEMVRW